MRAAGATAVAISCALGVLLVSVSCGGGGGEVTADTALFEAAIADYLDAASMDMEATEFRSLDVEGDSATALCRMEVKDSLYGGIAVRWLFTFRRDEKGTWRVE